MTLAEELLQAREMLAATQEAGGKLWGGGFDQLKSLLFRAASAIEQLEKDNVDVRSKCICVFCKQEFLRTDPALVEHLTSCDNSPLVQHGRELFAQVEELQALLEQEKTWKNEDPRMLREQLRIADAAYQRLHEDHQQLQKQLADSEAKQMMKSSPAPSWDDFCAQMKQYAPALMPDKADPQWQNLYGVYQLGYSSALASVMKLLEQENET